MEDEEGGALVQHQLSYWKEQAPTVDGMLGGYGFVDEVDAQGSLRFLDRVMPAESCRRERALDCGAGIGRVTKQLLFPAGFSTVDLLDINPDFLAKADSFIFSEGESALATATSPLSTSTTMATKAAIGEKICKPLDAFGFQEETGLSWDLIWVQWCVIYLKDEDFVPFFRKAVRSLASPTGLVVLKENVLSRETEPLFDDEDKSVTRSDAHLRKLWAEAGVEVVEAIQQTDFPSELYPVFMYALRAKQRVEEDESDGIKNDE